MLLFCLFCRGLLLRLLLLFSFGFLAFLFLAGTVFLLPLILSPFQLLQGLLQFPGSFLLVFMRP